MPENTNTLFERMGGASGVADVVQEMYRRVLDDPELAYFFDGVEMDQLHRMQYQFLSAALDGPVVYTGAELTAIHRGRGITAHHFAKFCGHFADAAESHGATRNDIDSALGRLATFKDKITGEINTDG